MYGDERKSFLVARGATPVRPAILLNGGFNQKSRRCCDGEKKASLTFVQSTTGKPAYTPRHDNGGGSGTGYLENSVCLATPRSILRCRTGGDLTIPRSLGRRFSGYSSSSQYFCGVFGC